MEPSSQQPQFGDADYNLAAFGREVCGGRLRWLATVLAALSSLLLICILAGLFPPDLQWPIHASGTAAKIVVIGRADYLVRDSSCKLAGTHLQEIEAAARASEWIWVILAVAYLTSPSPM